MITVEKLAEDFNLDIVSGSEGLETRVENSQLTRPGIELAGLFDFFEHDRVQIFGSKEITFFGWLSDEDKEIRVDMLFQRRPPAFIFSRHVDVPEVFVRKGDDYGIPVLKSHMRTSELFSSLYQYLYAELAPRKSIHGTLVDINGIGVLIRGRSGIGKSEVALELIRRGHQLVADDRVDIYEREAGDVIGEAPDILKKHLEIRGIGIINVVQLFGASAFKENKPIMLLVELVAWQEGTEYDRLGIGMHTERLFETDIPLVQVPTTAARNIPTLIEAAAMDTRLKFLGTNMAEDFQKAVSHYINSKKKNDN